MLILNIKIYFQVCFKNGTRVDGPWAGFDSPQSLELMVKANGGLEYNKHIIFILN